MSKFKFECETTRAQYKAIKKFDHHQLNIFVDDIYKKGKVVGYDAGYQQGLKTAEEIRSIVPGIEKILDAVSGVKGIGPKKLEEIKCAIEATLGGGKNESGGGGLSYDGEKSNLDRH